jgi:chromate reductase
MNDRYLIISGTNRPGSNTYKVAYQYQQVLHHKNMLSSLVSLEGVDLSRRSTAYEFIEKERLIPTQKFIFISPEYNGSIPGVLKTMLDISDYKKTWWGKKALLVGISTGKSGNVRGMEHLTSILNYMKVVVHPNKLPISSIDKLINGSGMISDTETLRAIDLQLNEFIEF